MKLARLYTNDDAVFPPITFRNGLNVIFARVKDPRQKRDSHNLGKTFLISVIDYALLATARKGHPIVDHAETFKSFVFFIDVLTHYGTRLTVRRSGDTKERISIHIHKSQDDNPISLAEGAWSHCDLGLKAAQAILSDLLDIRLLKDHGFGYRKGLRYFLRRQADYIDPFRLSVSLGPDRDWKPYVAMLLGYDPMLIVAKYDASQAEESINKRLKTVEATPGIKAKGYDDLLATIEFGASKIERLRRDVDSFHFAAYDSQIQADLVDRIDTQISAANNRLYQVNFDLEEIERSLATKISFDVEQVRRVFEETSTYFPPELLSSYDKLIQFNRLLSEGRLQRLGELRTALTTEQKSLVATIAELDDQRARALSTLSGQPTIEKFRTLQKDLLKSERELDGLRGRLAILDQVGQVKRELLDSRRKHEDLGQQIEDSVRAIPSRMRDIRRAFSEHAKRIMDLDAMLVASTNGEQNIEFRVSTLDREQLQRETSEGKGTSYNKMLCACFDLAILETYSTSPFYHFVYHDGIFEGLDNRRKVNLLGDVRDFSLRTGVQYILTVIDSDLPRDDMDGKLMFDSEEVIRELHDGGNSGRLFRMPAF